MSNGFQFLDIILLAMVAAFIALRLSSVLGKRTGHEGAPRAPGATEAEDGRAKVIPLPDRRRKVEESSATADAAADDTAANDPLAGIAAADRDFDRDSFVVGAKQAYELIIQGFARGERDALKPMLSGVVFEDFSGAIKQREAAGQKQETTIVAIKTADIVAASLKGKAAEITVRFVSDLINVTRDAEGQVVDGHASAVDEVTDVWTFARNLQSRDPNWTLIATAAPA
jgi:predicted lipid-binding transport protein (Tim44 family)